MNTKYEFTGETMKYKGHILHRIKATTDLDIVQEGSLGGWIESEDNLSPLGLCWVFDDAKVYGNALVSGNAKVEHYAEVYDEAKVFGNARLSNYAQVYGKANVFDDTRMIAFAKAYDEAVIFGNVTINECVEIYGKATLCSDIDGSVAVRGHVEICDKADIKISGGIYDNAKIFGNAKLEGEFWLYDDLQIGGDALLKGNLIIHGDAVIKSIHDYMVFRGGYSKGNDFIWTKSNDKWTIGFVVATSEEMISHFAKTNKKKAKFYEACVQCVEAIKNIYTE